METNNQSINLIKIENLTLKKKNQTANEQSVGVKTLRSFIKVSKINFDLDYFFFFNI
jgi:hypothetical protein